MTRQLTSTDKQSLLRSSHAKRPPQSGFVQVGFSDKWSWAGFTSTSSPFTRVGRSLNRCPHLYIHRNKTLGSVLPLSPTMSIGGTMTADANLTSRPASRTLIAPAWHTIVFIAIFGGFQWVLLFGVLEKTTDVPLQQSIPRFALLRCSNFGRATAPASLPLPTAAIKAVAVTGPTPGIVVSRWQDSFSRASCWMTVSICSMRAASCSSSTLSCANRTRNARTASTQHLPKS